MKKLLILLLPILILTTGCAFDDSATTVSENISKEANEFHVKRRITFINLRSNEYLFTITGNCSIKGGLDDENHELSVICRTGDNSYQKHFLYLANETTYVIEQLEYSNVSRYDYEIIFRPEAIIPIQIKTQVGEK